MSEIDVVGMTFNLLDLSGKLPAKFVEFLSKNNIKIISEAEYLEDMNIQYISVSGDAEFAVINNKYSCVKKNIKVIAISQVHDLADFILFNGKMIVDQRWFESDIGAIFLKRFFQEAGSVHIEEKLSNLFPNQKSFKIINHLRLGHYGDMLAIDAFENDFNLVSIRGFLYNIVYYLSYLKQANVAGVPIEVEYTANSKYFMINIHSSVTNFISEYLVNSFGQPSSSDNLQYLLKSSFMLADFFEITRISEPSKIVMTAVWEKSKAYFPKNSSSLILNNIVTAKQLETQVLDELNQKSQKKSAAVEELVDYSKKEEELENKKLPGQEIESYSTGNEESIFHEDPKLAAELVEHVASKIQSGEEGFDIKNLKEDDISFLIKGHPLEKEIIQRLTGEDKNFLSNKLNSYEVSSNFENALDQERLEIGKDEYIEQQRKELISEIKIRAKNNEEIEVDEAQLDQKLTEIMDKIIDADLKLFKNNKSVARELAEKVFIYIKGSVKKGDAIFENEIYKAMATVKRNERDNLSASIKDKKAGLEVGGLSPREEVLLKKLKKQDADLEELRKKLMAASVAISATKQVEIEKKEVQKKLEAEIKKIEESGENSVENSEFNQSNEAIKEKSSILESLKHGEINAIQVQKLEEFQAKEVEMLERARSMELELKKHSIESKQKEAILEQQLQAKERMLRAKDTAIEKSKENIAMVIEKKYKELNVMSTRFNALVSEVNKLKASGNEGKIKLLEREKIANHKNVDNLNKQMDSLKNKIKHLESQDKNNIIEDELKKAKREQISAESKLKVVEKDYELIMKKYKETDEKAKKLIEENNKYKTSLGQMTKDGVEANKGAENELLSKFKVELSSLKTQLEEKEKIEKAMEQKLKDLEANAPQEKSLEEKAQEKSLEEKAQEDKNNESPDLKRLKVQVERLEKDRQKMLEDARKKNKDQMDAINNYKKSLTDIKGFENRILMMEQEATKAKSKIAELTKKLQDAAMAIKKAG